MVCTSNVASGRVCPVHHSPCSSKSRIAGFNSFKARPRLKDELHFPAPTAPQPACTAAPAQPRAARLVKAAAAADATAPTAADVGGAPRLRAAAAVVLGIESSCDDTGVAVVSSDGRVLGEAIATQADVHAQWGGVVPNLARDAHAAAIDRTVDSALAAAGLEPQQLSAVAVTIGPGLGLCLRVGVAKARQMARQYGIPLVSVHHMEAHALVARLPPAAAAAAPPAVRMAATGETRGSAGSGPPPQLHIVPQPPEAHLHSESAAAAAAAATSTSGRTSTYLPDDVPVVAAAAAAVPPAAAVDPAVVLADIGASAAVPFPFLCLLVSGGHNLLVLVRGVGKYVQLGTTVDDALGEAYDKIARLLNLELRPHGGAALEALAKEGDPRAFKFAVPMRKYATCDFSFAGLKTNTRLAIEQQLAPERTADLPPEQLRKVKADIAASFQSVAVTHLAEKTRRGVGWARELIPELRHLVVAGGVACNQVVRSSLQQLAADEGLELVLPPPRWCTDNGVMVAWAGIERLALGWAEQPPPPPPQPPPSNSAPQAQAQAQPPDAAPGEGAGGAEQQQASLLAEQQQQQQPPEAGPRAGLGAGAEAEAGAEWIELKPRWPLTSELHPRSAAAQQELRRSVRRVRLHTPLSDLEPPPSTSASASAVAEVGGATPPATEGAVPAAIDGDATSAAAAAAVAGLGAGAAGSVGGGTASGREAGMGAGVEVGTLVGAGV